MNEQAKIDLVRSIMQVEGDVHLIGTCYNYNRDGGIEFTGYKNVCDDNNKSISIVMDKYQVMAINDCNTVMEIYECYKEMEYF